MAEVVDAEGGPVRGGGRMTGDARLWCDVPESERLTEAVIRKRISPRGEFFADRWVARFKLARPDDGPGCQRAVFQWMFRRWHRCMNPTMPGATYCNKHGGPPTSRVVRLTAAEKVVRQRHREIVRLRARQRHLRQLASSYRAQATRLTAEIAAKQAELGTWLASGIGRELGLEAR